MSITKYILNFTEMDYTMETIVWNTALILGIEKMDNQHKRLVDMTNSLIQAKSAGKDKDIIESLLSDLFIYTVTHFNDEEELMEKSSFEGLADHRDKHLEFRDKIMRFKEKYDNGDSEFSDDLISYLRDWLVDHIQSIDKEYAKTIVSA